jgi:hypothetical protein
MLSEVSALHLLVSGSSSSRSEAPTSSGCILAAITAYWEVVILRIGCAKGGWEMAPCRDLERVLDIAFCNDKLYGLMVDPSHGTECLIRYQVRVRDEDPPVVKAARRMFVRRRDGARYMDDTTAYVSYILELHGKPANGRVGPVVTRP